MNNQRSKAKTFSKMKLSEQKSDFDYWQNQSVEKRLATVEQIRLEYHVWSYDSQPRLQKSFFNY
jgi:hypothetical protein